MLHNHKRALSAVEPAWSRPPACRGLNLLSLTAVALAGAIALAPFSASAQATKGGVTAGANPNGDTSESPQNDLSTNPDAAPKGGAAMQMRKPSVSNETTGAVRMPPSSPKGQGNGADTPGG